MELRPAAPTPNDFEAGNTTQYSKYAVGAARSDVTGLFLIHTAWEAHLDTQVHAEQNCDLLPPTPNDFEAVSHQPLLVP